MRISHESFISAGSRTATRRSCSLTKKRPKEKNGCCAQAPLSRCLFVNPWSGPERRGSPWPTHIFSLDENKTGAPLFVTQFPCWQKRLQAHSPRVEENTASLPPTKAKRPPTLHLGANKEMLFANNTNELSFSDTEILSHRRLITNKITSIGWSNSHRIQRTGKTTTMN